MMEIVLGIDNIVFLSIIVGKLPPELRARGRTFGLMFALVTRLILLFSLTWIMGLTTPLFTVLGKSLSGRDLVLLFGGGFLIAKATSEIYGKVEGDDQEEVHNMAAKSGLLLAIIQIGIIDIIFSLDSVITAVGMADHLWIMVVAMIIAMGVMVASAKAIGDFVDAHPTIKILALAFLILIGVLLVAEAMGQHVSKGYIYTAMAFSFGVELLNMRYRKKKVR